MTKEGVLLHHVVPFIGGNMLVLFVLRQDKHDELANVRADEVCAVGYFVAKQANAEQCLLLHSNLTEVQLSL